MPDAFGREKPHIRFKKRLFSFAALSLITFLMLACGCDRVYIRVDGLSIKRSEFLEELNARIERVKKSNPSELQGAKGKRLLAEARRQVATELIKRAILTIKAEELGVVITNEEIERRILEETKKHAGLKETSSGLAASRKELRTRIVDTIRLEKINEKLTEQVEVNEDEAESFYLRRAEAYSSPGMVHIAHILLNTESEGKIALERINAGEEFSSVAASLSRDERSRALGGDIGWVVSGTCDPQIERVAFLMQPGEVRGPIRASDGYHVIKLIEKREARIPPFGEVKDKVIRDLLNQKKQEILSDWLKTVYANAKVDVPAEIGRWDPLLGMVIEE